jgi:2-methylcitrate dehydratase PrpD
MGRMTPAIKTFADYGSTLASANLSDSVRHHTKRALVDLFACLIPGGHSPSTGIIARALSDELGHGKAYVFGVDTLASPRNAALLNGMSAHVLEFDDIYREAVYHPGAPIVAAAMAIGQARGATGLDIMRAVVAGYEISTRIGAACQPAHYKFWHTTGTIGTFGAAAAAATLLRLDAKAYADALGTAGTLAAGLQHAYASETMSKPLHAGRAAEAGCLAALSAAEGLTGAVDILDGSAGFGKAMSANVDWTKAVAGLGEIFNITAMTFKNHGCCGHTFAAIDGALRVCRDNGLKPDDIKSVRIGTYQIALDVTDRPEVTNASEARFSLQYVVASVILLGSVRLSAFQPDRLADPAIRTMMDRIQLSVDPECDAAFPRRSAKVEIDTTDGRTFTHYQTTRIGDPDAPLSDQQLNDKFHELVAPALDRVSAEAILASLWRFEELSTHDVARLGTPS